jgi:hypothetical protein
VIESEDGPIFEQSLETAEWSNFEQYLETTQSVFRAEIQKAFFRARHSHKTSETHRERHRDSSSRR